MFDKPPGRLYLGRETAHYSTTSREGNPPRVARLDHRGYFYIYINIYIHVPPSGCVCARARRTYTCLFKKPSDSVLNSCHQKEGERGRRQTEDRTDAALPGSAPDMQSFISPVTKAILVALFIFAILLILYVILWYICRDVDCDHGI